MILFQYLFINLLILKIINHIINHFKKMIKINILGVLLKSIIIINLKINNQKM